jgi:hypothetical protein
MVRRTAYSLTHLGRACTDFRDVWNSNKVCSMSENKRENFGESLKQDAHQALSV